MISVRNINSIWLAFLVFTPISLAASTRSEIRFDDNWQFHLGDLPGAENQVATAASWRAVNLPHDWSAEGEFSKTNASCTGFLPGGIGWYCKKFNTDGVWKGRKVFITFDGVYRDSDVWINGHHLGHRPYGFSTFQYDLTPFLNTNGQNNLAVRVKRENVADLRWYPGSGIYRDVWLTVTDPVHIALWGNEITTPHADSESANVVVRTDVTNETATAQSVRVVWQIEGLDGKLFEENSQTQTIQPGATYTFSLWQKLAKPQLWSLETPALYQMGSRVFVGDELRDETRTPFGVRTFVFDPNRGFFLNGVNLKIKGLCMHHDAGVVGAAVPEDVLARRLRAVKEIGGNAIRCSHNPMSPELYDLCDRIGLLVMDEAFDEWEIGKRKWVEGRNNGSAERFGYSKDFDAWAEQDCADMVRRDRNHPCIVMWSIGNEIDYPTDPYVLAESRSVEGFNQDSRQPQQTRLTVVAPKLISAVRRYDTTRPVTMALANMVSSDATGLAQMLDAVGYNYQEQDYERDHKLFPARVIYGSENSRGVEQWDAVKINPFVSAQFLWVGFDFLGEANQWPNHGSQAGLFDTRGFKKVAALQRQAIWSDAPMVAIAVAMPSRQGQSRFQRGRMEANWTWPENTGRVRVVAFSNCDKVDLRLNGQSLGTKPVGDQRSVSFDVDYTPGELTAVGYRGETPAATNTLTTAGEPAALSLESDRASLTADGRSIAHVIISVVDARGNLTYQPRTSVTVEVQGMGRLLGVDNGDQNDTTALKSATKVAEDGRLLAMVQSGKSPGTIALKVTAPNLKSAELNLPVEMNH